MWLPPPGTTLAVTCLRSRMPCAVRQRPLCGTTGSTLVMRTLSHPAPHRSLFVLFVDVAGRHCRSLWCDATVCKLSSLSLCTFRHELVAHGCRFGTDSILTPSAASLQGPALAFFMAHVVLSVEDLMQLLAPLAMGRLVRQALLASTRCLCVMVYAEMVFVANWSSLSRLLSPDLHPEPRHV